MRLKLRKEADSLTLGDKGGGGDGLANPLLEI
jgi:hypothetical protein